MDVPRQHPLPETLGELTKERLFQRILLQGLSQQDVGRFTEVTVGAALQTDLVQSVHTQTGGNPLFVTEVVRLLVQNGELTAERLGSYPGSGSVAPLDLRAIHLDFSSQCGHRRNQITFGHMVRTSTLPNPAG